MKINVKDDRKLSVFASWQSSCSVGAGVERFHLDTADTLAVNDGDLHVASVTPGGAPRVTHDPVLGASSIGAPSDDTDGVIEGGTALGGVEDTRLVNLEDSLVSLDGDGEDGLSESSLHLVNVVGGDVGVARNDDVSGLGSTVDAFTSDTSA